MQLNLISINIPKIYFPSSIHCQNIDTFHFFLLIFYMYIKHRQLIFNVMRKKIKLSVPEIVNKKTIQTNNNHPQHTREKQIKYQTFDDLYNMMKNQKKNCEVSQTSSIMFYSKKCTPQNTGRKQLIDGICQSLEKAHADSDKIIKRSYSAPKSNKISFTKKSSTPNFSKQQDNFASQYLNIIKQLNHNLHSHVRQTQCFLNYKQLEQILLKMHFIRNNQKQWLQKIWEELGGETYGGIVSQNLQKYLKIIEGIKNTQSYPSKQPKSKLTLDGRQKKKLICYIDENLKLKVSQKDKRQIYSQFNNLRMNRILIKNRQKMIHAQEKKQYKLKEGFKKKKQITETVTTHESLTRQKRQDDRIFQQYLEKPIENKQHNGLLQVFTNKQKEFDEQSNAQTFNNSIDHSQQIDSVEALLSQLSSQKISTRRNKKPILSVDVNLGEGITEKIIVYEGQTSNQVANRLAQRYNIDENMKTKFERMLESHIRTLLWKIQQVSEQLISDRQ